jgi:hypothetical protein
MPLRSEANATAYRHASKPGVKPYTDPTSDISLSLPAMVP